MGYIEDTAKTSGAVAKASTRASFAAVSILTIPLLELVLMAGLIISLVALPMKLFGSE